MESMKSVLVTGGTGFIGSHLVRSLIGRGVSKIVVNTISDDVAALSDVADRVEVAYADLGSFTDVLRIVDQCRPETIFHIGAMLAPACDDHPEAGIRANGLGTYHVLESARLLGVRQVIFASSMSVFAGGSMGPSVVNDMSTTRPNTVYAAAKLFSENLGLCYRRLHKIDFRGIRLPNVNGPGAKTHGYLEYFNKAIEQSARGCAYSIYVEPYVRIPILHIDDAVRAFQELAAAPEDAIKTVNYLILGPPAPTAQELVDTVKARIPDAKLDFKGDSRLSALIDSVGSHPFDDHFARSEWGWKLRYDLDRIVQSFIDSSRTESRPDIVSNVRPGLRSDE